ncbi:MAG: MFS transporter [Candidatus Krumholzibacteria bacterium]|nr:MFS transporter [Candidatus Krumholzibacteria bacterium]
MSGTTDRKAIFSWAMYDWANSAFATTVMAGFFPVFFNEYWSSGADTTVTTARLALANSAAGIAVALFAPVLGSIADRGSARKRFLVFFAFLGAVMTSSLWMVSRGDWKAAIFVFILASIGFSGSIVFNDSLLVSVAGSRQRERVSALGYGLGYLGGGLLFALNIAMTLRPESFGLAGPEEAVRYSFLTVGVWWAVFTIPLIMFVKEKRPERTEGIGRIVTGGIKELIGTFRAIRRLRTVFLFLLAYWLYIDGVDTIVRMAVDYGMSIGLERNDLILALLVTQFVGFPSAIAFGRLGARIGARRAIFIAIGVYLFVTVWAALMDSREEFYVLAVSVGLVQGGIQALSRSLFAGMIPEGKSARYFGFYNMIGKFAAVMGPVLIGTTGLVLRSFGTSAETATRLGITSVSILFIGGAVLLWFVDEDRARREILEVEGGKDTLGS